MPGPLSFFKAILFSFSLCRSPRRQALSFLFNKHDHIHQGRRTTASSKMANFKWMRLPFNSWSAEPHVHGVAVSWSLLGSWSKFWHVQKATHLRTCKTTWSTVWVTPAYLSKNQTCARVLIALNGIYFLTSQRLPSGEPVNLVSLLSCSHTKGEPGSKQGSWLVTALTLVPGKRQ